MRVTVSGHWQWHLMVQVRPETRHWSPGYQSNDHNYFSSQPILSYNLLPAAPHSAQHQFLPTSVINENIFFNKRFFCQGSISAITRWFIFRWKLQYNDKTILVSILLLRFHVELVYGLWPGKYRNVSVINK